MSVSSPKTHKQTSTQNGLYSRRYQGYIQAPDCEILLIFFDTVFTLKRNGGATQQQLGFVKVNFEKFRKPNRTAYSTAYTLMAG